jgi:hypothetical protein
MDSAARLELIPVAFSAWTANERFHASVAGELQRFQQRLAERLEADLIGRTELLSQLRHLTEQIPRLLHTPPALSRLSSLPRTLCAEAIQYLDVREHHVCCLVDRALYAAAKVPACALPSFVLVPDVVVVCCC